MQREGQLAIGGANLGLADIDGNAVNLTGSFFHHFGSMIASGTNDIQRNIICAAKGGRIVNIAYQKSAVAEVNFLPVMLKQLTLTGSTLRARPLEEKTALVQTVRRQVWPWLASGRLKPIIDSTFALEDAKSAHERMESSAHIGKIILTTGTADL